MSEERLISTQVKPEDFEIDQTLRPTKLRDFVGQSKVKQKLEIYLEAAKKRQEVPDHILLFGPPGLGKTTLAYIVAKELNVNIKTTSGPVLERPGDLVGILTNLEKGDVLFIDEIHRLNHTVEEYLYPAMEDFFLDVMIDKGPNARSVKINLPPFTLIGATTRSGLLTSPLRERFGIVERLDHYTKDDIERIVARAAKILGIEMDASGADEIARRSRGTPRVANRILRRVRDFAQVRAQGHITKAVAQDALQLLEVDSCGLDDMDKRILKCLLNEFDGGPVGVSTLSIAVGEQAETLEEIYEPFLIQSGFIKRTPSGRMATRSAYLHFGITPPAKQSELL